MINAGMNQLISVFVCFQIKFKDVKFIEPQSRSVKVTNTGQVPVCYEFINKPKETNFCKPWLNIEPSTAVINVGKCMLQRGLSLMEKNFSGDFIHF